MNQRINIKGTSDGLIISLGAGMWNRLMVELDHHLGQKASFFKGGRVALRVGARQLNREQIEHVGELLINHQVSLWAVECSDPATQIIVTELGLEVTLTPRQSQDSQSERLPQGQAIMLKRTLRSGQVINHPGDVTIVGDINPGAEVRAGGSLIVWGRLRGVAHAGLGEQAQLAIVCALQLAPTQLRINNIISRTPYTSQTDQLIPEIAFCDDNQIVVEPWQISS